MFEEFLTPTLSIAIVLTRSLTILHPRFNLPNVVSFGITVDYGLSWRLQLAK
jgi:hypothetical protein